MPSPEPISAQRWRIPLSHTVVHEFAKLSLLNSHVNTMTFSSMILTEALARDICSDDTRHFGEYLSFSNHCLLRFETTIAFQVREPLDREAIITA
jgi:hypothetical protein